MGGDEVSLVWADVSRHLHMLPCRARLRRLSSDREIFETKECVWESGAIRVMYPIVGPRLHSFMLFLFGGAGDLQKREAQLTADILAGAGIKSHLA